MQKIIIQIITFLILAPILWASAGQADNPAKGEITLKIQKIWQTENAGKDMFARIRQLMVADNGDIYMLDRKNRRFYILDREGKLIKAFGKKGEGPGEFRIIEQCNMFLVDNALIIHDDRYIHFLDQRGNHIRTKMISRKQEPILFLDKENYISAHRTRLQAPDGKGTIRKINIKTGTETVISKFSLFEGGAINNKNAQAAFSSVALTPMMCANLIDGKLFYGVNDVFKITVADLNGKTEREFGILRPQRPITTKRIEERLIEEAKDLAPVELLKRLAKTVPNQMTHFSHIEKHKGLFYVYTTYYGWDDTQRIDIFSPEGKYLYRAFVKVDEDYQFVIAPVIKNDFVYIVMEDDEGNQSVSKYKIELPTS